MSKRVRGAGRAGLAVLGLAVLGGAMAAAAVLESDVTADSELELLERAESGAYQRYSIRLTTVAGVSTLFADKDGVRTEVPVQLDDTLALWRDLLKEDVDVETLADASPERAEPDQSRFTVKFRVKDARGGFSAYGIDSLPDGRHRHVVRAILKLADTEVARARAR